jgi:hypothetical protein
MDNFIKVYLDDERSTPGGWTPAKTPDEVISLLKSGVVSHLSLDHDLGDDEGIGTGYDVLLWLEEQVSYGSSFVNLESIAVHSANVSARIKMEQAIEKIENIRELNRGFENRILTR